MYLYILILHDIKIFNVLCQRSLRSWYEHMSWHKVMLYDSSFVAKEYYMK